MLKPLFLLLLLGATACSSDNGSSPGSAGTSGNSSCPDVSGSWHVTKHCEPSLVGATLDVTETNCALTFAAPFNEFMGSVTADGKITLSGPQTCSGTATAQSVSLACTPGTCAVALAR